MNIKSLFKNIIKKKNNDNNDSYKIKADKNKERIIKADVKKMKTECMKEFERCIENGVTVAYTDFFLYTTHDFLDDISEIVLEELKIEHKNINFSFSWRHCNNSYKGIRMLVI